MTAFLPIEPASPACLRRPRLLMRAARFGLSDYRRERDLKRILPLPSPDPVLDRLAYEETRLETARLAGAAGYSPLKHIEVMIALLAELRLCSPAQPQDDTCP